MYRLRHITLAVATPLLLALHGCALLSPPQAGITEQDLLHRMGTPTAIHQAGTERLLEYGAGNMGQHTYMARIGHDGRLVSYDQVWTIENFNKIVPGTTTREQVLHLVGHPLTMRRYPSSPDLEAWNYGFKESGVWNSEMSIYIDQQGIVRKMENGPDWRYEPAFRDD